MTATKLCIPEKVLDQHLVVLGKTGAGKSSALRHVVEHLLARKKRVCVIDPKGDWWGLKVSADGKSAGYPVILFGGFKSEDAGDVPINDRSGKHIAELVATGNRPCVIGLRGWTQGAMTRFWIDFASTLFAHNAGELYLVGDEFHNFAPKQWKGKSERDTETGIALHWANRLLSEGRGLGIVCLVASQRPQKVHNDTLTSCETLVAMRVVHAADRAAVKDWVDGNGDAVKGKEVLNSLAALERGEAWVWSPEAGFGPQRVRFPLFTTFDSFAPPQLQKKVSGKGWADVNLDDVKQKLAAVIEEERARDPKELQKKIAEQARRIRELEATDVSASKKPAGAVRVDVKRVEVPVITDGQIKRLEALLGRTESRTTAVIEKLAGVVNPLSELMHAERLEIRNLLAAARAVNAAAAQPVQLSPSPAAGRVAPPAVAAAHRARRDDGQTWYEGKDGKPARGIPDFPGDAPTLKGDSAASRMLAVLANAAEPLPDRKLAARAGVSRTRSTYRNALSDLRKAGYLDGDVGARVLTEAGRAAALSVPALPTGAALVDYYRREIGDGAARRIFETLVDAALVNGRGQMLARAQIAERCGIDLATSTFRNALSDLRKWDLIDGKAELALSREMVEAIGVE